MGDDARLNRIEDKLDSEIQASATFRGELRQYMKGQTEYTDAVNAKASSIAAAVQAHKDDPDAHGAGVKRQIDVKVLGWAGVGATLLASFGGVIGAWAHKLWNHQ